MEHSDESLSVRRVDRDDGREAWEVSAYSVKGGLATVTGFDSTVGPILLPAVSSHYWPAELSHDTILRAVADARMRAQSGRPPTPPVHWLVAWRGHVASGRATPCGYETALNVCNKPGVSGREVMDCVRCQMGTQQNRFARLTHGVLARRRDATRQR